MNQRQNNAFFSRLMAAVDDTGQPRGLLIDIAEKIETFLLVFQLDIAATHPKPFLEFVKSEPFLDFLTNQEGENKNHVDARSNLLDFIHMIHYFLKYEYAILKFFEKNLDRSNDEQAEFLKKYVDGSISIIHTKDQKEEGFDVDFFKKLFDFFIKEEEEEKTGGSDLNLGRIYRGVLNRRFYWIEIVSTVFERIGQKEELSFIKYHCGLYSKSKLEYGDLNHVLASYPILFGKKLREKLGNSFLGKQFSLIESFVFYLSCDDFIARSLSFLDNMAEKLADVSDFISSITIEQMEYRKIIENKMQIDKSSGQALPSKETAFGFLFSNFISHKVEVLPVSTLSAIEFEFSERMLPLVTEVSRLRISIDNERNKIRRREGVPNNLSELLKADFRDNDDTKTHYLEGFSGFYTLITQFGKLEVLPDFLVFLKENKLIQPSKAAQDLAEQKNPDSMQIKKEKGCLMNVVDQLARLAWSEEEVIRILFEFIKGLFTEEEMSHFSPAKKERLDGVIFLYKKALSKCAPFLPGQPHPKKMGEVGVFNLLKTLFLREGKVTQDKVFCDYNYLDRIKIGFEKRDSLTINERFSLLVAMEALFLNVLSHIEVAANFSHDVYSIVDPKKANPLKRSNYRLGTISGTFITYKTLDEAVTAFFSTLNKSKKNIEVRPDQYRNFLLSCEGLLYHALYLENPNRLQEKEPFQEAIESLKTILQKNVIQVLNEKIELKKSYFSGSGFLAKQSISRLRSFFLEQNDLFSHFLRVYFLKNKIVWPNLDDSDSRLVKEQLDIVFASIINFQLELAVIQEALHKLEKMLQKPGVTNKAISADSLMEEDQSVSKREGVIPDKQKIERQQEKKQQKKLKQEERKAAEAAERQAKKEAEEAERLRKAEAELALKKQKEAAEAKKKAAEEQKKEAEAKKKQAEAELAAERKRAKQEADALKKAQKKAEKAAASTTASGPATGSTFNQLLNVGKAMLRREAAAVLNTMGKVLLSSAQRQIEGVKICSEAIPRGPQPFVRFFDVTENDGNVEKQVRAIDELPRLINQTVERLNMESIPSEVLLKTLKHWQDNQVFSAWNVPFVVLNSETGEILREERVACHFMGFSFRSDAIEEVNVAGLYVGKKVEIKAPQAGILYPQQEWVREFVPLQGEGAESYRYNGPMIYANYGATSFISLKPNERLEKRSPQAARHAQTYLPSGVVQKNPAQPTITSSDAPESQARRPLHALAGPPV